jgi:hypothetical protein
MPVLATQSVQTPSNDIDEQQKVDLKDVKDGKKRKKVNEEEK